jgi:hypothetical protein
MIIPMAPEGDASVALTKTIRVRVKGDECIALADDSIRDEGRRKRRPYKTPIYGKGAMHASPLQNHG